MRIGILTFHRAHNYGAVLQAYALQEVLKGMGHDVKIIDYRQPAIESAYNLSFKYFFKRLANVRVFLRYVKQYRHRRKIAGFYESFISNNLLLTAPCHSCSDIPCAFDVYIVGSDQVWNFNITNGIDEVYTGDFHKKSDSKTIGYAISSARKVFETAMPELLSGIVENFSAISFRESALLDIFMSKVPGTYSHVIDPVLLTDASKWSDIIDEKWGNENYVLLYQVRLPKDKDLLKKKARVLADKLNCRVIDISEGYYSVADFVSLFKYARYVVTSSFHGTAFSLLFERPMYIVKLDDGHDDRYKELLERIGANIMLVDKDFKPTPIEVDYAEVTRNLMLLRRQSLDFLNHSIFR